MATPYTCAGFPLLTAEVQEPEVGPWRAEVTVDALEALSGRVTLALGDVSWVGTVVRSSVASGKVHALLVGGAGSLATDEDAALALSAKAYRGASLGTVLADLLAATGERLSAHATALTGSHVPTWSRPQGPAKRALEALAAKAGLSWRVGRDGALWLGTDTWPASGEDAILTDQDAAIGMFELRDGLDVRPGTTYAGERVRFVTHRVEAGKTVTEAWTRAPSGVFDRQRELMRREVDLAQLWPAVVVSQRADGTLEVVPDDAAIRGTGLDGVVICPGLPGVALTVPTGARCYLAFAGGDPSRPRVVAWDTDTFVSLVRLGGAGADFVALATQTNANLNTILNLLQTWVVAPNDGGLALQTAAKLLSLPSVAATKLKTV